MKPMLFVSRNHPGSVQIGDTEYSFHDAIMVEEGQYPHQVTAICIRGPHSNIEWTTEEAETFWRLIHEQDIPTLIDLMVDSVPWHGEVVWVDRIPV